MMNSNIRVKIILKILYYFTIYLVLVKVSKEVVTNILLSYYCLLLLSNGSVSLNFTPLSNSQIALCNIRLNFIDPNSGNYTVSRFTKALQK